MPIHPVIDQTIHRTPLDAVSIVAYATAFVAVAVVAYRRPAYGVAGLIAFVPFALYRDIGPTAITLFKVALVAMAGALLARRSDFRELKRPGTRLFLVCGTLVVAATALSIWHATYRGPAVRETLKSIEYVLLFATVAVAAATDVDQRPIRIAFAGIVAVVSILAIAQEVTGAPSGIWIGNHPIPVPRIAGPLEGPNQLAGYLGIALAVVTAFAIRGPLVRGELAALALGSAALVLTISRAGIFASLLGVAVVFLTAGVRTRRRGAAGAIVAGCAFGVAVLALWGLTGGPLGHLFTVAEAENPGTVGNRSEIWNAAVTLWRAHPFFGVGAGNFESELGFAGYPKLHTHANSLYLQSLVEGGIPLLAATLALVGASIARFARGPFSEPLIAAAFGASIGFGVHQIVDLLVFYPKVGELWWIVLALGAVRFDSHSRRPEPA